MLGAILGACAGYCGARLFLWCLEKVLGWNQMTDSHACDACGGSGSYFPSYYKAFADRIGRGDCPVCLGAGRISDRMPAKDVANDIITAQSVMAECAVPGLRGE